MDFSKITNPQKTELLIVFADIQNFMSISQTLADPLKVFELMNAVASIIIETIEASNGRVLKFIGDECLIVFPPETIDAGTATMIKLKKKVEKFFSDSGFSNKLRVTAHFGEVAVGKFGRGTYSMLDIMGDAVNIAASLGRGEHRGRIIISPQVFRKLSSTTRKLFHKYTPPMVYLAD